MARHRIKRGLGRLLKELRTSPLAALINGILGVGGMLGGGLILVLRLARSVRDSAPGQNTNKGIGILYLSITFLFLLGGFGFLLFALLQLTTRIRIFDKGMAWHRHGKKRIIFWVEVEQFGRSDEATTGTAKWSMLLRSGERVDLHSAFYHRREFEKAMELIGEQIEETQRQFG